MADAQTLAVYKDKAGDYAARFGGGGENRHLLAFIKATPKGGHVLDLGCGPGNAAATMMAAGLVVDATDASPQMVTLAQKAGVAARLASFDEITGQRVYDGIWASFSLLHAPKSDFPRHLAALHQAMKPGAILVIGMKTGTGEHRDALSRFYAYYSHEELERHLTDAGFTPTGHVTGEEPGLDGTIAPFIIMTAHG